MDIIVNPIGGLANRMRAIASAVAMCNDHNFNLNEIAWPINSDLHAHFEAIFKPLENIRLKNISALKNLYFYDEPRKKNLFLSRLFQINRYGRKYIGEHPDLAAEIRNIENGKPILIQSGSAFYDFNLELYRKLFIPAESIISEASKRIGSGAVGLHIRRTDNRISIENSPTELFIDAIQKEIRLDDTTVFYLATDDDAIKRQLASMFGPQRIIFSTMTASRNTEDGIREAAIELFCLSRCRKIYGSFWSSFSEAAAMLGDATLIQLKK